MATLTPINPTLAGVVVTPITPGSDTIPALAYTSIELVLRSVSTGAPTITINDPTSVSPSGAVAFNPDVTLAVTAGQLKVARFPCSRFRDENGNITYTTATPGDAVVYAIGYP